MGYAFERNVWLYGAIFFIIGWAGSVIFTAIVYSIGKRFDILEQSNHRTIHRHAVPKLGGIAIFMAMLVGSALASFLLYETVVPLVLIVGGILVHLFGIYDDLLDANCYLKLLVQLIAAGFAISGGFVFHSVAVGGFSLYVGWIAIPLSLLWIAGISNAVNLIDGLDGLASGVALSAALTMALLFLMKGDYPFTIMSLLMAGTFSGFLLFNWHPSRIFMGDCGSLLIGYLLGSLSLKAAQIHPGTISLFIPMLLLGLPVFDTALAVIRRLKRGVHPFHADNDHVHHQLMRIGLSHRRTVMLLIMVNVVLCLMALKVAIWDNSIVIVIIAALSIVLVRGMLIVYIRTKNKVVDAILEKKFNN